MKKLILLMLISTKAISQDSVWVYSYKDDMSGKTYLYPSTKLVIAEDDKKKGLIIDPFIEKDMKIESLYLKAVGFKGCNEDDELIIMLADSSKITSRSYKGFNCEGEGYYKIKKVDGERLAKLKILKVRWTNGKTYDSYTKEIDPDHQEYFIKLYAAISKKNIKPFPKKSK